MFIVPPTVPEAVEGVFSLNGLLTLFSIQIFPRSASVP